MPHRHVREDARRAFPDALSTRMSVSRRLDGFTGPTTRLEGKVLSEARAHFWADPVLFGVGDTSLGAEGAKLDPSSDTLVEIIFE